MFEKKKIVGHHHSWLNMTLEYHGHQYNSRYFHKYADISYLLKYKYNYFSTLKIHIIHMA